MNSKLIIKRGRDKSKNEDSAKAASRERNFTLMN